MLFAANQTRYRLDMEKGDRKVKKITNNGRIPVSPERNYSAYPDLLLTYV